MTISAELQVGFMAMGDLRETAALEARAVDSMWIGGHIASRNPSAEALMNLARLSAVTERVRIGTSILLLPLYPPAIVAKQITDLDNVTGGRVTLGVGVGGEYPGEFRACQIPLEERGPRTNEAIELLRKLWTAEEISHSGPYYGMQDVRIHPAPVQPGGPPIVVAGRQEVAMRRAARLGDGWMPYLYSPRRYAKSVAVIEETAAADGRSLDGFEWFVFLFVNVDPDGAAAREAAAASMGGTYDQNFLEMVDRVAAAGTVAEVTRRVIEFVDAGARHLIFTPATLTGRRDLIVDRILDEVMPAVRAELDAREPTT